ncbi:MAG: EF-hand domain-containing protein [Alphaproteobacteria bacterium]|nr:EF-hand domain-containing protein [Alphaproteobacteria bacterium]
MKRIFIPSLVLSVSAFAFSATAQEVFQPNEVVVSEAYTSEEPTPLNLNEEVISGEETIAAPEEVVETQEEVVAVEEETGPQNIVNIPSETPEVQEPEAVSEPSFEDIRKDGAEKAVKIFNAIDADANGTITQEEFLDFHAKLIERKISKMSGENTEEEAQ